jgi:hypothetical protein
MRSVVLLSGNRYSSVRDFSRKYAPSGGAEVHDSDGAFLSELHSTLAEHAQRAIRDTSHPTLRIPVVSTGKRAKGHSIALVLSAAG